MSFDKDTKDRIDCMFRECANMGEKIGRDKLISEMLHAVKNNDFIAESDRILLLQFIRRFCYDVEVTDKRLNKEENYTKV